MGAALHNFKELFLLLVVSVLLSPCLSLDDYFKKTASLREMNHIQVFSGNKGGSSGTGFGSSDGTVGETMIVNGQEAGENRFPYMVSIQILEEKYKRYHICAAVLITTNKALTAAHCMDYWGGIEHFAAVGFTRLSDHGQALVRISDVEIHPNYKPDKEGFPNDIAIITFEEHVALTDRVQVANFTMPGDPNYSNYYCIVTGWGFTEDYYNSYPDELRYAVLIALKRHDCKNFFKIFESKKLVRNHHLCGWLWPYSACYGDSGGPLVCNGQVVGITSWAADCTGCHPTVFARITSFWEWIERHI